MEWQIYWDILRRRWVLILAILILDVLVSGFLYARTVRKASFQACTTLYVADVSSPSTITAPQTTIDALGQLLAGETAANFFADDIIDVAESQHVTAYVSSQLKPRNLPSSDSGSIAVGGSRRDRTDQLCVTNPNSDTALAAAQVLGSAMSAQRGRFVGPFMAHRTYVGVVSNPTVGAVSTSHDRLNLLLQLFLGLLLAIGLALLWDWLDPRVRNRQDVEAALGVPVLAGLL